jgi:hypothetical protein
MPGLPAVLTSVDTVVIASLDYQLAMKTQIDLRATVTKFNEKCKDKRPQIFAIILSKATAAARAHMTRDAEYITLKENGDDPLALRMPMRRALVKNVIGNSIA